MILELAARRSPLAARRSPLAAHRSPLVVPACGELCSSNATHPG
ncbi:MAG: hypothetical protein ACYDGN_13965 [Acidimicrobiales bacterium]